MKCPDKVIRLIIKSDNTLWGFLFCLLAFNAALIQRIASLGLDVEKTKMNSRKREDNYLV